MTELARAVELLNTASRRTSTVTGSVKHWTDTVRARATAINFINRVKARSPEGGIADPQPEVVGEVEQEQGSVWFKRPDWIRTEFDSIEGRRVLVNRGSEWWTDDGVEIHHGLKNGPRPHVLGLLEPTALLEAKRLDVLGVSEFDRREVILVVATPQAVISRQPFSFGLGASEYQVSLDVASGIVLRSTALAEGEGFESLELHNVVLNAELDDQLFTYRGGADRKVLEPDEWGALIVPFSEAHRVPFRILVPHPIPPSVSSITVFGLREGQPNAQFRWYDETSAARSWLHASESLVNHAEIGAAWESVTYKGVRLDVRRDAYQRWCVAIVRDGVRAELTGEDLDKGRVLDVAISMRPII